MNNSDKPIFDIISNNLSGNCLGRALVFADILKRDYRVRILGMLRKNSIIWKIAGNHQDIEFIPIRYRTFPLYLFSVFALIIKIKSSKVIAVKPLFSSFGTALLLKLFRGRKVILDIDDNELAWLSEDKSFSHKYLSFKPDRYLITKILSKFIKFADQITVCNGYLQSKYGGAIIPHAREPEKFVLNSNKAELKNRLGIDEEKFVICHIGSYRPHKGLDRVVEALDILED